jgi:hypothetical protein
VHEAIGVEASSEATKTTTILLPSGVPILALEYVATLVTADTPAGLAVCEITTAIYLKD